MSTPLIDVRNLSIAYRAGHQLTHAVRGLSLQVQLGETLAIVGESGSGKTTLANALFGVLPASAQVSDGHLHIAGADLTRASQRTWQGVRGRTLGLVPQDPMVSLNPTQRIGRQIAESLVLAHGSRYPALDADVLDLLSQVGLDNPAVRARQYPHELSGGMRQRVLIAIALAGNPQLIVADEPTSALDVTVQRRILDHLEQLVRERGIALVIITHDLGVAADRADQVLVMKNGEAVEYGPPAQVLSQPAHPYTRQLLAAAPAFGATAAPPPAGAPRDSDTPLLALHGVSKIYRLPGGNAFTALNNLSLQAWAGHTLAIVGESGSGKSTTLRLALGLEPPDHGRVHYGHEDVTGWPWNRLRPLREQVQLVQQNPFAALDPRLTIFDSVVAPLRAFKRAKGAALVAAAARLMDQVQLPVAYLDRLPRELSGGQRQRVAIARALALKPQLLLLDEPVSALDVSVQAQVLALLAELQRELGLGYVLVSHDLAVVRSLAHQVLVLRHGEMVEQGSATHVFGQPQQAYTRELLAALPGQHRVHPVPAAWPRQA